MFDFSLILKKYDAGRREEKKKRRKERKKEKKKEGVYGEGCGHGKKSTDHRYMCVCNRHRKSKPCIRSICPCRKFEPKFDRNLRGIDM